MKYGATVATVAALTIGMSASFATRARATTASATTNMSPSAPNNLAFPENLPDTEVVPEPASMLLLGSGLVILAVAIRRRGRRRS